LLAYHLKKKKEERNSNVTYRRNTTGVAAKGLLPGTKRFGSTRYPRYPANFS